LLDKSANKKTKYAELFNNKAHGITWALLLKKDAFKALFASKG